MQTQSKKHLTLTIIGVLVVLLFGILSSPIINYYSYNWDSKFEQIKNTISGKVQKNIHENELRLNEVTNRIKNQILAKEEITSSELLEIITLNSFSKVRTNIFLAGKLVGWNKDRIVNATQLAELKKGKLNKGSFFLNTPLNIFLAKIIVVKNYLILSAIPVEKKYNLSRTTDSKLNFIENLENEFNAVISMAYDTSATPKGISISNTKGFIVGSLNIKSISRDAEIAKLSKNLELGQSLSFLFTFIIILSWFYQRLKGKNEIIKLLYILLSTISFRLLLFWSSILDLIDFSNLISPIYFSSTFGNGIAKSPLELFITVLTILIIAIKIYNYVATNLLVAISKKKRLLTSIVLLLIFILLYNWFAATIKSIIFDSSILYFKDALIFSSYQTAFMYLNILLIGLIAILFSISIIIFIISSKRNDTKKDKKKLFSAIFVLLSLLLIVNELFLANSSLLLVAIYSLLVFITSYYWINHRVHKASGIFALLLASSILSISFLNFFNSTLERNSLKTITNELTRSNIEFYEYYLDNAVEIIKANDKLPNIMEKGITNFDEIAFSLWSRTGLPKEVKHSAINIIDSSKTLLGSFSYEYNNEFTWNWENKDTYDVTLKHISDNNDSQTFSALIPIVFKDSIIGYIEVIAYYGGVSLDVTEGNTIWGISNKAIDISVNPSLLRIFEFTNGQLNNYHTNIFLTNKEEKDLTSEILSNKNDTWLNIKINNEDNIFYLKKYTENGKTKTLAVGLREKDITWNLYNFFKVFFIHSIMIVIFLLLIALLNFRKWNEIQISFKTKILIALLIISIIPLILLAAYFKNVSSERNNDAINYKLGKKADNVEEYLNNYIANSTLTEKTIFEKAGRDLGVSFSLFDKNDLLFSTEGNFYKAGLLPKVINPLAYLSLNVDGLKEIIITEQIENIPFNSLYHRIVIGEYEYIIKICDLFNKFQLPMTGIELNVMLFGTYSLAIILIIILSTLLANQISAPIEKLTKATRSVSRGDMDIQIDSIESGEIKELIDGFNLMVRELKKNQIELAEVERESAWREMAKQVAHEIKNPLTPMKLAVQHLVVAHNDKSEKFNSIFEKVTKTIIAQIDTLKNIASEFSSFAKMPSIKLEEVNLIEIVNETVNLFIDEECEIIIDAKNLSIKLLSDKEQAQRMFVNLIRNSIQAGANKIIISLKESKDLITIEIADNGNGITDKIKLKIFDENFTTKKSGMGLGLALTKRFLNMINGVITVKETSPNGTILLIEIKK